MDLSIIIPCYNEYSRGLNDRSNQTLRYRLRKMTKYLLGLSDIDYELIFVDDGSTDKTSKVINDFMLEVDDLINWKLVSYKSNNGKGYAIKRGIRKASGDYILFMDADLAVPLENILVAFRAINKTNCIIADRYLRNDMSDRKLSRRLVSFFAKCLIRPLLKNSGIDTQCGFKMFPREVIVNKIEFCRCNKWLLDVELLIIFESAGIDILALPVKWNNMVKSTIGLNAVISSIKELTSIHSRRDILFNVGKGRITSDKVE